MGNTFGVAFRVTTFGESHGGGVGCVVDGCPAGLNLDVEGIQRELDRRRPGQSRIVSQRRESDTVEILSGVFEGVTLGTPLAMLVRNEDARSRDYDEMRDKYRPSHADFTYEAKYGVRAWPGGGRSSARETVGRVAAGAVARQILREAYATDVVAWVERVQDISSNVDPSAVTVASVDETPVRCPDLAAAERMIARIEEVRKAGDSVGGTVAAVIRGVPPGWGEPVFDRLEADLAKAMLSLPATKGFEVGSGFGGTYRTGREHNDPFYSEDRRTVRTRTNQSGGVQGGISNGEDIVFRVAFKPTATILHEQETVTTRREPTTIAGRGRHDPCVLPRAVPMVEAMAALVLVDHALRQQTAQLRFLNNS
ncbi:MAG: chorismate synthase [Fimbriimonadaceae bacterium]